MAINFGRLEEISRALKDFRSTGQSFHVTFAYHGNKLLAIGQNDYSKLHRYHKFGKYLSTKSTHKKTYNAGIHSEVSALLRLGLSDCDHITFVNIRIDNNGNPAISKPCLNCNRIISEQFGYKNFWYYDGNEYVKLKH